MMIFLSSGAANPGTNFGGSGTGSCLGQLQLPSASGVHRSNCSVFWSVTSDTTGGQISALPTAGNDLLIIPSLSKASLLSSNFQTFSAT